MAAIIRELAQELKIHPNFDKNKTNQSILIKFNNENDDLNLKLKEYLNNDNFKNVEIWSKNDENEEFLRKNLEKYSIIILSKFFTIENDGEPTEVSAKVLVATATNKMLCGWQKLRVANVIGGEHGIMQISQKTLSVTSIHNGKTLQVAKIIGDECHKHYS